MKQHTTPEQTAKLIELGFKKPRIYAGVTKWEGYEPICTGSYTIGELIEMLEGDNYINIRRVPTKFSYAVICFNRPSKSTFRGVHYKELIDALYAMILQLKEKGVI